MKKDKNSENRYSVLAEFPSLLKPTISLLLQELVTSLPKLKPFKRVYYQPIKMFLPRDIFTHRIIIINLFEMIILPIMEHL